MVNRFCEFFEQWKRFTNDVPYDLAVPPFGLDYYHMTTKHAKENYQWFISIIPNRMAYFRNRCASDLKVSECLLDYSPASLVPIWEWFIKTARIEKTPKEELKKMIEGAKIFGDSWICREQFSVATRFIMRDIGIYIGESFVRNYMQLKWAYYDKPKNNVDSRQPIISGFYYKNDDYGEGEMIVNPIAMVEGVAASFFDSNPYETELFDSYIKKTLWIPD